LSPPADGAVVGVAVGLPAGLLADPPSSAQAATAIVSRTTIGTGTDARMEPVPVARGVVSSLIERLMPATYAREFRNIARTSTRRGASATEARLRWMLATSTGVAVGSSGR
jgi:hypothetical protein